MTKAGAYKVILHMNRYNTKCTWLQNVQVSKYYVK